MAAESALFLAHGREGIVCIGDAYGGTLEVFGIAAQAHRHGVLLVVHSATKYLGGHSDLTAGALMGNKALLDPVWAWRKNLGQMSASEERARRGISDAMPRLSIGLEAAWRKNLIDRPGVFVSLNWIQAVIATSFKLDS